MKRILKRGWPLFVLMAIFVFTACGTKAPPLPPIKKAGNIAAPYGVKAKRMADEVHLSWKHMLDEENAAIEPEIFEIFVAQKTFEACEGCPFEFRLAGKTDGQVMEFFVPVQKGFKYYFRIQATDDDALKSTYSETVQVEYE